MSCDTGEAMEGATEGFANEALLILQPFRRCFTYVALRAVHATSEFPKLARTESTKYVRLIHHYATHN